MVTWPCSWTVMGVSSTVGDTESPVRWDVQSVQMTHSDTPAEPGWYPHPEGRKGMQRYWNGEDWSGAPRKAPPELKSSGILLIVVGTIALTIVIGLIMRSIY